MVDISKLKKEIIAWIEESNDPIYKIAFYSNEEVVPIANKLMEIWEKNERRGIPLDYATEEEIVKLHKIAKKIISTPPDALYAAYGYAVGRR